MTHLLKYLPVKLLMWFEYRLLGDYDATLSFVTKDNSRVLQVIAEKKLEYAYARAIKTPAYVKLLEKHGITPKPLSAEEICRRVPVTDKKSYINAYPMDQRCIDGKMPTEGNVDESAGSSGIPTNWVRSYEEQGLLLRSVEFEYKYTIKPKKDILVISTWSSGPWATGVKFCEIMEHFSLVKNTSTDTEDIKRTLKMFGTKYQYLIAGYPLFLQALFESKFPWKKYDIDVVTGGDGYSPMWPSKVRTLLKGNPTVVSAYGCSDIDIGIGFESPFAQEIRAEAAQNRILSKALFSKLRTIPMLFQYNPALHFVQNLPNGEFAVTHLDPFVVSPKLKYNVHDRGGTISYRDMIAALEQHAPRFYRKIKDRQTLYLPFLYVGGRSSGTISIDGANVYPQQLDIIFTKFCPEVRRFKMTRKETKQPFQIMVEARKKISANKIADAVIRELPKLNQDYKETLRANPSLKPVVETYKLDKGPFKPDNKIKYQYVV